MYFGIGIKAIFSLIDWDVIKQIVIQCIHKMFYYFNVLLLKLQNILQFLLYFLITLLLLIYYKIVNKLTKIRNICYLYFYN